jgi:Cu+-exporting ATPase
MENVKKISIKTKGMHCVSCERLIKDALLELNGVKNAKADYPKEITFVEFDSSKTNLSKIMKAIKDAGYEPYIENKKEKKGFLSKIFG